LPLTFANPADYDKVREDDRVAVVGLPGLGPDKPLTVRLTHADGSTDALEVRHTMSESQIRWFQAGSSLNALAREQGAA
jgi:aconitate hydratase